MRTVLSLVALSVFGVVQAGPPIAATCQVTSIWYHSPSTGNTYNAFKDSNGRWSAPLAAKGLTTYVQYDVTPEISNLYKPFFDSSWGMRSQSVLGTEFNWESQTIIMKFLGNPLIQNNQDWYAVGAYQEYKALAGKASTASEIVTVHFEN
jgi:hypothetical protein